jgi:fructose-1,6-bisphosphatase/inositol monophosphatase family enzyme
MNIDPREVLDIIIKIADEEILPRFQQLAAHDISEKGPGDIVTIADIEAERRLTTEFQALLSGSKVVGEEGVAEDPDSLRALDGDGVVWIVDPVDGTQNFADGKSCFAVMAALCINHEPYAGWIHDPINGISVYAMRGQGAWKTNGQVHTQIHLPLPMETGGMTGSLSRKRAIALDQRRAAGETNIPDVVRRYRCVGREYMDLALGKLHFLRYGGSLKPWDHVPGIMIHREMGGYDAFADSQKPYQVFSEKLSKTIMLARSPEKWMELTDVLGPPPDYSK